MQQLPSVDLAPGGRRLSVKWWSSEGVTIPSRQRRGVVGLEWGPSARSVLQLDLYPRRLLLGSSPTRRDTRFPYPPSYGGLTPTRVPLRAVNQGQQRGTVTGPDLRRAADRKSGYTGLPKGEMSSFRRSITFPLSKSRAVSAQI